MQTTTPGPRFDVVSIKRNMSGDRNSNWVTRPDGGIRGTNLQLSFFIARAYPPAIPADFVGLPDWARTERYDIIATSTVARATDDDRAAMLRDMLAERCKLVVHIENRDQPVYELVFAHEDHKLGPGLAPTEIDCEAKLEADRTAAEHAPPPRPSRNDPTPRCTLRTVDSRMDGDSTLANLALALRPYAGRRIVDKTGLAGFYRVRMTFDPFALLRGPNTPVPPGLDAPSIVTAIQQDLGLKLSPSRDATPTVVIDRIERPTEN